MLLKGKANRFGGFEIAAETLPDSAEIFEQALEKSIRAWQQEAHQFVFLTIPIGKAHLIAAATKLGFDFHHCSDGSQTGEAYLNLVCRLRPDAYVLHAPTHHIAIGGVVINEKNELLVIHDVMLAEYPGRYSLPGGYVDPGEHLAEAVEREVFEETHIKTRFEALHCVRHTHQSAFKKSNLYFISRLTPLTFEPIPQKDEVLEVRWLPLQTFFDSPQIRPHTKAFVRAAVDSAETGTLNQAASFYDEPFASKLELFLPREAN